jgi:hypothetical protein
MGRSYPFFRLYDALCGDEAPAGVRLALGVLDVAENLGRHVRLPLLLLLALSLLVQGRILRFGFKNPIFWGIQILYLGIRIFFKIR